jgi:type IV secretory pathway TraG/TraD family ATPase VirD4
MPPAALSRADLPEHERRDFYVYLDEFQNFSTLSLATMPPELRKYHLGLTLAHQHLAQLEPPVREAVLGNVGTMVTFRVAAPDVALLEPELSPEVSAEDLVSLPNSRPFSAQMLTPLD